MTLKNARMPSPFFPLVAALFLWVMAGLSGCAHDPGHAMDPMHPMAPISSTMSGPVHSMDQAGPSHHDQGTTGNDPLEEALGIKIVSLRTTAMGRMLDLRYQVTNPQRASELIKRNSKMEFHIIDNKTGHVLRVPMTHLGLLRARTFKPKENGIYYTLFENPEGMVKSGSEVSILFGSLKVDGWRVE